MQATMKPATQGGATRSKRKSATPQKRGAVTTQAATQPSASGNQQSVEQRREVRREYRKLLDDLDEHKQDLVRPESIQLEEKMKKGNEIYSHVTMPREAALDSEFLHATSQLGLEQVTRLHAHFTTYDASTFIQRVRRVLLKKDPQATTEEEEEVEDAEQEMDWEHLGKQAIAYFKVTPTVDFLYGPLSATPKERKARTRQQKEELGKKVVPEEVKNTEADAEEETSKRVERMAKALQSVESKRLFEFLANPSSFSQTVENLFHLSFLIKEGRAGMDISKIDGTPILRPMNPPEDKSKAQNRQCVVKFDHKTFLDVIDVCGIKKPFLEHRPAPQRPRFETSRANGTEPPAAEAAAEATTQRKRKGDKGSGKKDQQKKRRLDQEGEQDETEKTSKGKEKDKEKEKEPENDGKGKERERLANGPGKRKRQEAANVPEKEREAGQKKQRQDATKVPAPAADKGDGEKGTERSNAGATRKETEPAKVPADGAKKKKTMRMEIEVKIEPGTAGPNGLAPSTAPNDVDSASDSESDSGSDSGSGSDSESSQFSDSASSDGEP